MNAVAKMPETAKARGKIAPAKLAHVVLRTQEGRVGTILDWYKKVLEGEAMYENPAIGFVTYDTEHHRIAVLALPGVQEHVDMTCGMHHIAFTYENLGDLLSTYNRIKDEHGITPEFCINHGPTTSMYYFDPDKNQIELQVDNIPEEKFGDISRAVSSLTTRLESSLTRMNCLRVSPPANPKRFCSSARMEPRRI